MCGAWWSFMKMLHLFFKHAFGLLFPFSAIFMLWNTKMQPPTFKCNVSVYLCKTMISTDCLFFFKKEKKKISFTLCFRRLLTMFFLQKQYLRGSSGLHLPAARGEELRGNVNTVTLDKPSGEKLQRASPCFYLKDGQRRPKSDCTWSLQSPSYSHSLSWECTFPGPPHQVTVVSERTHCDVLHSALRAPESNALANASACNGGCQHHLHSIDPAPTWGRTIRACLW